MSLTLFANNERSSNSPITETVKGVSYIRTAFYREKKASTYSIKYLFLDDDIQNARVNNSLATAKYPKTEDTTQDSADFITNSPQVSASTLQDVIVSAVDLFDRITAEAMGLKYKMEYSLNNGTTFQPFPLSSLTVDVAIPAQDLETEAPYIQTITVAVTSKQLETRNGDVLSSVATQGNVTVYSISAVFLKKIPQVDFVAYPTYVIEENKYPTTATELTPTTFRKFGKGLYFYGEGHTETIQLSARIKNAKAPHLLWLIGDKVDPPAAVVSKFYVDLKNSSGTLADVKIDSSSGVEEVHDIGVKLQDLPNYIGFWSPTKTYDDVTGGVSFYPFYAATVDTNGDSVYTTDIYKAPIRVLTYPDPPEVEIKTPFPSPLIQVPADKDSMDIVTKVTTNPYLTSFLTQTANGTYWNVEARAVNGTWSVQTATGPYVQAYGFTMKYDADYNYDFLPPYTASLISDTSLLISASSSKSFVLRIYGEQASLPVNLRDWKPKTTKKTANFLATVVSSPLEIKPFFSNYYNAKYAEVPMSLVHIITDPYSLSAVDFKFNNSNQTIRLSPDKPEGKVIFNKIGKVDVTAIAYIRNKKTQEIVTKTFVYNDLVEVLEKYETVKTESMHSKLSPQKLSFGKPPLLSPNEWLTSSTINTTLIDIYNTFKSIDNFSNLYEQKDNLYAWFSFQQAATEDPILQGDPVYTWATVECDENNPDTTNDVLWYAMECRNSEDPAQTKGIKWMDQLCQFQQDPECLQRHCLQWSWRKRKRANSDSLVTWKSTRTGEPYNKKWAYEKCDLDSNFLQCSRTDWCIQNSEPRFFPIPTAKSNSYCKIVDIDYLELENKLVVAHEKEIRLLKNTKTTEYICRKGQADDLYPFQEIVGLAVNSSGNIFVLDRLLARVSVYTVKENSFSRITSWGDYGTADNAASFVDPRDIHVDQDDFIWVADTGNKIVKKFTITGTSLLWISHSKFEKTPPLSMCVDVEKKVHILTDAGVMVFDEMGTFLYEYELDKKVKNPNKINTNYIRQMLYITSDAGIAKYFRNGNFSHFTILDYVCKDQSVLTGYNNIIQDKYRNVLTTCKNKVIKIADTMKLVDIKGNVETNYWTLDEILVDKNEMIQPWVYMRSFHRLWDNIEALRFSLFYEPGTCRAYDKPVYDKAQFVIGQNELVTNTVFNRLIKQIWENMRTLVKYFDLDCEKN